MSDGFTDLLEQLPLGVVEMTADGDVTFVNESARLLMAGPPGAEVREVLTRLGKGAWASKQCVEHSLALGRVGELRLWASPQRIGEGVIIILERHSGVASRLESKLMSMLVRAATGVEGWHVCATRALETLCASLPGTHLVMYEVTADKQLNPTAHAALKPEQRDALRPLSSHPAELVGRVFHTARMQAVSPITASPLVLPFAYPASQPLAAIAVPLMGSRGMRGVFYACGPEHVLQENEARLLLQLAEMLGLLLEQKGREERVATERDRYGSLLDNLPDAVLELNASGVITLAGGGTLEVFGLEPQALVGRTWHEWVSAEERARVEVAMKTPRRERAPVDVAVHGADAVVRTCGVAAHAAPDQTTRLVFRDMTAVAKLRKDAHTAMEAASRNERLAILGRLTAGVGHELNNPLSYLTTNLSSLREELDLVDTGTSEEAFKEMRSMIDDCEEGVKRLVSIVQALKGSSRQGHDNDTVFDPSHAVSNAVTLFRGVNRHRVNVEWQQRSLPLVQGSVSSLSQVVLNLLQNGFDAMGGKGKLAIFGSVNAEDGSVRVEIVDEGPGIPVEVQPHVFEPFYTTKPEGTGTGLGLYLCLQMVQGMGGALSFQTGEAGTRFLVELPVAIEDDDDDVPALMRSHES